jgi:hypothetical protein
MYLNSQKPGEIIKNLTYIKLLWPKKLILVSQFYSAGSCSTGLWCLSSLLGSKAQLQVILKFCPFADRFFMLKAPQDPTETTSSTLNRLFFKLVTF